MKKMTVAILAGLLTTTAFADQGDIIARLRVIDVSPQNSTTSTLSALDVHAKSDTVPELDFTYMITNNIGAELILGTSRHEVDAGSTDLGKVSVLPPTLTLQYHFTPQATFRPYVGAGLNYTRFYDNELNAGVNTPLSVKSNSFGPALQVGADYMITKSFFVNVDVKKLWVKTDVSLAGAPLGTLTLNPWVYGIGVGTTF
jgi:outer membrane protein